MKEKISTKKHTIKDEVLDDFLRIKKEVENDGINYFPSGLLKYYLYDKGFLTYAGRIIGEYCKKNNIQIVKASTIKLSEWKGEKIHGNNSCFLFNK